MDLSIRRFDKDLPLPEYKTAGAAAMDLYVREGATVPPHQIVVFNLNIAVKPPAGHFALMAARSSLRKRGLMLANGIGILDEDYAGDEDEYRAAIYNFTDVSVEVQKGERRVQLLILPYEKVTWHEVETLGNQSRGGFGT